MHSPNHPSMTPSAVWIASGDLKGAEVAIAAVDRGAGKTWPQKWYVDVCPTLTTANKYLFLMSLKDMSQPDHARAFFRFLDPRERMCLQGFPQSWPTRCLRSPVRSRQTFSVTPWLDDALVIDCLCLCYDYVLFLFLVCSFPVGPDKLLELAAGIFCVCDQGKWQCIPGAVADCEPSLHDQSNP